MTKEEAVARIKDHIEVHHIKEDRAIKIVQALNMAIEALERTEWHYPSKGEYPLYEELVLCTKKDGSYLVGSFDKDKKEWVFDHENLAYIDRWQYIVPPKEEA